MTDADQLNKTAALIIAAWEHQLSEQTTNRFVRAQICYEGAVLKRAIACARAVLEAK